MVIKDFFIRNLDADSYRENFLISAVVSLFVIRIFLRLTHYPQLGTGGFHIAHMLWGGFFMLATIIIMISFLSKTAANVAAVLGGIGFGTFIDELGKFITSDNNYFFRPTIAFIYIIFVLVYLLLKFIPRLRKVSQKEYLVNAVEMIKEAAINDFDIEEEKQAAEYIKNCDPKDPTVQAVAALLSRITALPTPAPGFFTRLRIIMRNGYTAVARSGILLKIVFIYLAFQTADTMLTTLILFLTRPHLPFSEWGMLFSSGLAAIFVILGFSALRFSKVEAYRFLRISVLISILLTQFFAFMRLQWLELFPLTANLCILVVINYAMYMEKQKRKIIF